MFEMLEFDFWNCETLNLWNSKSLFLNVRNCEIPKSVFKSFGKTGPGKYGYLFNFLGNLEYGINIFLKTWNEKLVILESWNLGTSKRRNKKTKEKRSSKETNKRRNEETKKLRNEEIQEGRNEETKKPGSQISFFIFSWRNVDFFGIHNTYDI